MGSKILVFILIFLFSISISANMMPAYAEDCNSDVWNISYDPHSFTEGASSANMTIKGPSLKDGEYRLRQPGSFGGILNSFYTNSASASDKKVVITLKLKDGYNWLDHGDHSVKLQNKVGNDFSDMCDGINYNVGFGSNGANCTLEYSPKNPSPTEDERITITVSGIRSGTYPIYWNGPQNEVGRITINQSGNGSATIGPFKPQSNGNLELNNIHDVVSYAPICGTRITIRASTGEPPRQSNTNNICCPTGSIRNNGSCEDQNSHQPVSPSLVCPAAQKCDDSSGTPVCTGGGPGGLAACPDKEKCSTGGGIQCPDGKGIKTALGCLQTDPSSLIKALMRLAVGIAGAIALILMIIGSVQMLTSAGNPELIKKGRDTFVSAVIGLLFIIFSITILQIIGVDILNIPGFVKQ